MNLLEYIVFTVLVISNIALGLYFSFGKKHRGGTTDEMFLGERNIPTFALAVSVLATMMSAVGIIGFTAHFYAYGIHILWFIPTMFLTLPLVTHVITPVLYKLQITSIFEYLRLRFGNKLGVTASVLYFFFGQSLGALAVHASSIAVSTVFHVPLMWSSIAIGFTATVYTALAAVQRYLAARTLKDARRTAWIGTAMISVYFIINMALGLVMTYWYRGCDPELSGEISTHDQIIPFYVVRNLASFPGFSGIFLAGIVGATTSTTSSLINSLTAICYIDIASQVFKITETSSKKVTKGIALDVNASGVVAVYFDWTTTWCRCLQRSERAQHQPPGLYHPERPLNSIPKVTLAHLPTGLNHRRTSETRAADQKSTSS
ncbi:putative sodium-dependent multivitamin transporter isoform X1 [Ixodes scapularis]